MHRCLIPSADWHGARVALRQEATHYLFDVLRLVEGDEVRLFDGTGREVVARLCGAGPGGYCEVLRELAVRVEAVELVLYQAIPKQRRMELIVEKATELGVSRIVPMVTERTIVRLDVRQAAERRERWQRLVEAAARQCGRGVVPVVEEVAQSVQSALGARPVPDVLLVGVIRPDTERLGTVLGQIEASGSGVRSVGMVIGPEGDLTPGEVEATLAAGGRPVTFGPQVLRVETAALFALSVLSHRLCW